MKCADLDDLVSDVEELRDDPAGTDADQLEKVETALAEAKGAIDVIEDEEEEEDEQDDRLLG